MDSDMKHAGAKEADPKGVIFPAINKNKGYQNNVVKKMFGRVQIK